VIEAHKHAAELESRKTAPLAGCRALGRNKFPTDPLYRILGKECKAIRP